MNPLTVQYITAQQAMDLRMRVLRPGQPRSSCEYAEDHFRDTFHLAIVKDGKIMSNGTFMKQEHPKFEGAREAYRLRGMATDPAHQGLGLGRLVIESAEQELSKRKCDLLWFNARTSAEGFYLKMGFTAIEETFEITGAGPHKVMYKWYR